MTLWESMLVDIRSEFQNKKKFLQHKTISKTIAGKIRKPGTPKPSIQLIDPSKLKILLKADIKNRAEIRILPIKSKTFAI